jgi:predicted Zn-dependent protease
VLAALAARSSPDMASAAMMGGSGLAAQRQLNFSREAEREADRVGLQIMRDGGYDTSGMVAFFGRLQASSRGYSDTAPAYLRTHPLTTERIADIQGRILNDRYRQHADSPDFQLMRARARVLQDPSPQGLRDAASFFDTQMQQKAKVQVQAARYGLAVIALRQGNAARAQTLLDEIRAQDKKLNSQALTSFGIEIATVAHRNDEAVRLADAARNQYPLSRGIALQYGQGLLNVGRNDDAVRYLRDQTQMYRQEPELQELLARAYAAQGKAALQHMALAEAYALKGGLPAALDQLSLARRSPDASFYDQSVIDAREREFKARRMEEVSEKKGK